MYSRLFGEKFMRFPLLAQGAAVIAALLVSSHNAEALSRRLPVTVSQTVSVDVPYSTVIQIAVQPNWGQITSVFLDVAGDFSASTEFLSVVTPSVSSVGYLINSNPFDNGGWIDLTCACVGSVADTYQAPDPSKPTNLVSRDYSVRKKFSLGTAGLGSLSSTLTGFPTIFSFVLTGSLDVNRLATTSQRKADLVKSGFPQYSTGSRLPRFAATLTVNGVTRVPIPATLPLAMGGLLGLGLLAWRRRKAEAGDGH